MQTPIDSIPFVALVWSESRPDSYEPATERDRNRLRSLGVKRRTLSPAVFVDLVARNHEITFATPTRFILEAERVLAEPLLIASARPETMVPADWQWLVETFAEPIRAATERAEAERVRIGAKGGPLGAHLADLRHLAETIR